MAVGNLNANIADPEGNGIDKAITETLSDMGIKDFWIFIPAPQLMGAVRIDMKNAKTVEGGAVPDRLHYWVLPKYVPERLHLGPQTQHRTLNLLGCLRANYQRDHQRYLGWGTKLPCLPQQSSNKGGCNIHIYEACYTQTPVDRET